MGISPSFLATTKVQLPLGDGRFTAPICPKAPPWPIPVYGGLHLIVLVLDEWIEGPPDDQLKQQLAEVDSWKTALAMADHMRRRLPQCDEDKQDERWFWTCQFWLTALGLPATPGTTRFLMYEVDPDEHRGKIPLPTRGARVTSLALVPDPRTVGFTSHMVHNLVSISPGTPSTLLEDRAVPIMAARTDWWKEMSANLVTVPKLDPPRGNSRGWSTRKQDELNERVDKHEAGELSYWKLLEEAKKLVEEFIRRPLLASEAETERRKVNERLRRRGLKKSHD